MMIYLIELVVKNQETFMALDLEKFKKFDTIHKTIITKDNQKKLLRECISKIDIKKYQKENKSSKRMWNI